MGSFAVAFWCLPSHGARVPEHVGSVYAAHRLSSCGVQAQLPRGMWDLRSPVRDWTSIPCIGRQILNHWTTREVPDFLKKINMNQFCLENPHGQRSLAGYSLWGHRVEHDWVMTKHSVDFVCVCVEFHVFSLHVEFLKTIIIVRIQTASSLWNSLPLSHFTPTLISPLIPSNHWGVLHHHSFISLRASYKWNHYST